jgi:hypothetical protein
MSPIEPWNRIIEYWGGSNLSVRPGATLAELAAFEAKYDVFLPIDFSRYLQAVDGTGDDYIDDCLFRFWPLAEIKPVHEELDESAGVTYPDHFAYPNCFVFADHCFNCWLYAVKFTKDPAQPAPVFRVTADDIPGEQMAPSFFEFMKRYANDPDSIL